MYGLEFIWLGHKLLGSTLGATDEVRVDPPILHHQSNNNYLTQCFIYDLWLFLRYNIFVLLNVLELKHLYYYTLLQGVKHTDKSVI